MMRKSSNSLAPAARNGDHLNSGKLALELQKRLDALLLGHDDVENLTFEARLSGLLQSLRAIGRELDEIAFPLEDRLRCHANQLIVVNDEDSLALAMAVREVTHRAPLARRQLVEFRRRCVSRA